MIYMADCKQAAKLLSQRHVEAVCGPGRDSDVLVVIILLGSIGQCLLLLLTLSVLDRRL